MIRIIFVFQNIIDEDQYSFASFDPIFEAPFPFRLSYFKVFFKCINSFFSWLLFCFGFIWTGYMSRHICRYYTHALCTLTTFFNISLHQPTRTFLLLRLLQHLATFKEFVLVRTTTTIEFVKQVFLQCYRMVLNHCRKN